MIIGGGIRTGGIRSGGAVGFNTFGGALRHDGLLADFVNGRFYTKPGNTFANAQSMFTWSSSTKYTLNSAGVLVASGANTPAYEYSDSGVALGILCEGPETNPALQSQAINTTPWGAMGSTITANAATAPDGTLTAERISGWSTSDGDVGPTQVITISPATRTFAIYLKGEGADIGKAMNLRLKRVGGTSVLSDKAVTLTANWQRADVTLVMDPTNTGVQMILSGAPSGGNNASGCLVWQGDLHAGATRSSPIPTTTASVTRNADAITRTLGAEWGAAENTVLIQGRTGSDTSDSCCVWQVDNGNDNDAFRIRWDGVMLYVLSNVGGVAQANMTAGAVAANTSFKIACRFAANDFAVSLNGAAVVTDTSGTIPTVTTMRLGSRTADQYWKGHVGLVETWPSLFTNAQLQGLAA